MRIKVLVLWRWFRYNSSHHGEKSWRTEMDRSSCLDRGGLALHGATAVAVYWSAMGAAGDRGGTADTDRRLSSRGKDCAQPRFWAHSQRGGHGGGNLFGDLISLVAARPQRASGVATSFGRIAVDRERGDLRALVLASGCGWP